MSRTGAESREGEAVLERGPRSGLAAEELLWLASTFSRIAAVEASIAHRRRYCLSAIGARVCAKVWLRATLSRVDGSLVVEETAGSTRAEQEEVREYAASVVRCVWPERARDAWGAPERLGGLSDALTAASNAAGRTALWLAWSTGEKVWLVSFHRSASACPFTAPEAALIRFGLNSARWLFSDEAITEASAQPSSVRLTPAQLQVLILLVAGESKPAIARGLHRSLHTIDSHTRAIYGAFGVRGRAALVRRVSEDPGLCDLLAIHGTTASGQPPSAATR